MTVASALDRKTYTGDDATVAFATSPVVFFDETDLQVYVITTATGVAVLQSLTTDYTVSGGAGSTGTVTMLTAPASTETLLIKRVLPITQGTDFVNNDVSDAEVAEDALDKLTMIAQQLAAGSVSGGYPLRISDAETPTDALTILPFDRASKLLGFNTAKELVVYDPASGANDSASVTFVQSGTGAVSRTMQAKARESVSVLDFGAVGDGVTSDDAGLLSFFTAASGNLCVLPAGTYKLAALLDLSSVPLSNCVFSGVPGLTIITGDFAYTPVLLGTLSNVVFEGITFKTTYTNAADGAIALIHSINKNVSNVTFRRCTFTAPNANIDGLGFYPRITFADATAVGIDGLWIEDCTFENGGRFGCTLMNRGGGADKYTNAKRVYFNRNKGLNLGLSGSYGFLLSLDGFGSNFEVIGNEGDNCLTTVIENTGWQHGKICDNKGLNFPAASSLLSIDGTDAVNGNRPMLGLTVTGNKCITAATQHSLISDCLKSFFAGNYFNNTGANQAALLRRSFDCDFKGETYDNDTATGTFALFSDETSSRNRWDRACIFDNSASSANNATVRFADACTDNIIEAGATISKGTGGSSFDQTGTAALNYVEGLLNSWTPTIYGAGTAGTPTYSVQAGSYSLVGKLFSFALRITTTAVTGMVGDVRISLPFTAVNTSNGVQSQIITCAVDAAGVTIGGGNTYFVCNVTPNTNYAQLMSAGSAADANVQSSALAAATTLIFSGQYMIA